MCDNRLFHDFPRLAKESGFYFNYRSKRIDWSEIDKIDLEDIAKNKRFERLEEKLELVINCDLDDDVTKVLDCNFVKLFRLAQLSVSYLRHCQFYLDRCIILLQEQLSAALKDAESVRSAINIHNPFKCMECNKTFMSASYLESHQRRRHTPSNELEKCVSIAIQTDDRVVEKTPLRNSEQQTEEIRTRSFESQTSTVRTSDVGMMTDFENNSSEKVDFMEQFESICRRIEIIEKQTKSSQKLVDEKQASYSEFSTLLQNLLPVLQQGPPLLKANSVAVEGPSYKEMEPLIDLHSKIPVKELSAENDEKLIISDMSENEVAAVQQIALMSQNNQRLVQDNSSSTFTTASLPTVPLSRVRKKVNIPVDENTSAPVPRPRPRKSTINRQKSLLIDIYDSDTEVQKPELQFFTDETTEKKSFDITPITSLFSENVIEETKRDIITASPIKKDNRSIKNHEEFKTKQKSMFKTFVKKSSPKFKGLRKTISKSWSNFSDSKLFSGDNMLIRPLNHNKPEKLEEERDDDSDPELTMWPEKDGNLKKIEFEKKLRKLGVDPEWSGIPENSYIRIKAILDQQRLLMEKKNPAYLRTRNHLESLITQRIEEINKNVRTEINNAPIILTGEQTKMYDIESESDSEDNIPNLEKTEEKAKHFLSSPISTHTRSFNLNGKQLSSQFQMQQDAKSTVVEIQAGITGSDSSDSSEIEFQKENKPPFQLKSSMMNKGKDEAKKKVVFADNFELETSHDIMKIEAAQSSNSSTSSSDWDIPMP